MANKRSKRYQANMEKIKEVDSLSSALKLLKELEGAKFEESVEVHAKLGIDPSKTEQQVRFSVDLPNGTGKTLKVAVLAEGDKAKEGKEAGADLIFGEEDIQKLAKNKKIDFDVLVATPQMMPKLAKVAKILGPKGLMPSPKNETVTQDVKKIVGGLKKGRANVKSDAGGSIHQIIGKISQEEAELEENYKVLMEALEKNKPEKIKGKLVRKIILTTTMGPGIRVK